MRESSWLSAGYVGVAAFFRSFLVWQFGTQAATEFLTGYVIETSLSLDNVFVIASTLEG